MTRAEQAKPAVDFFVCMLAALTFTVAPGAHAAESAKIHVVEAKYGDFLGDKTCAPDLSRCDGLAKCSVDVTDALCKSGAAPDQARLQIIWDCGELKHAGMAARGKKVIVTCPYQPNLN